MKREIEIVDEVEIDATDKICFAWMLENKACTGVDIRRYFLDAYGKWTPGADGFTVDIEDLKKFSFIVAKMNRVLNEDTEDQDQGRDQEDYDQEQYEGEDQITDSDR